MGTFAGLADLDDVAPVGFQDALYDAQAQAQAARAGGEKGGEDARLEVGGDAGAGVLELDLEVDAAPPKLG